MNYTRIIVYIILFLSGWSLLDGWKKHQLDSEMVGLIYFGLFLAFLITTFTHFNYNVLQFYLLHCLPAFDWGCHVSFSPIEDKWGGSNYAGIFINDSVFSVLALLKNDNGHLPRLCP
jgi:hypothetical protein